MTDIDYQAAFEGALFKARGFGHNTILMSAENRHEMEARSTIEGVICGEAFVCSRDGCPAFVVTIVSDGTDLELGEKGNIVSVFEHSCNSYRCGERPNAKVLADFMRLVPGTPTKS